MSDTTYSGCSSLKELDYMSDAMYRDGCSSSEELDRVLLIQQKRRVTFNDKIMIEEDEEASNGITSPTTKKVLPNGINHTGSVKDKNKNNNNKTNWNPEVRSSKKISRFHRKNVNVKRSPATGDFDASQVKMYLFLQSRIYLLSSLIGDRTRPYNSIKGYFGLALWILNFCIHFTFDFYEAYTVFHVSWASSIGVYAFMFIISTIFLIRHTVRWYIKMLKKLSKEKIYNQTLTRLYFIFKLSPLGMFALSVSGAGAQYGCYAYDDALTISFKETHGNMTQELLPKPVHIVINVVRFTSLMHIYYMMFLLLFFAIIIFYTIVHSQRLFNEHIGNELKTHPPSMTFQEAVDKIALRSKLLRNASENTTIIFSTVLLANSLSFVVNAYNFLFIKRYAVYIWFAIAPLFWTLSIMIGSAFVTSSYQKLKLVVIQSWVEIPEKYDELWSRRVTSASKTNHAALIRSPVLDWRAGLENVRRRKTEREAAEKAQNELNPNVEKPDNKKQKKDRNNDVIINMNDEKENINNSNNVKDENVSEKNLKNEKHGGIMKSFKNITNMIGGSLVNENNTDEKTTDTSVINEEDSIPVNQSYGNISHRSFYDNVDTRKRLATTTGDESSYLSGEEYRETSETGFKDSSDILYSEDPSLNEQIRLQEVNELKKSINNAKKESTANPQSPWKKTVPKILLRRATKPVLSTEKEGVQLQTINAKKPDLGRTGSNKLGDIVRLAQTVNKFTSNTKRVNRRKFNYEKYIKYLELTLDTVGFSLGKVTITWDRVSFFIVLLSTLVGVFAQNAFLK